MMICPRCEGCIRHGEQVRVCLRAMFFREDLEGHRLEPTEEEWVEHLLCFPDPWWRRLSKWIRRLIRQ